METYTEARMTYTITRAEMAKMISIFVDKTTTITGVARAECVAFTDLQQVNEELQGYITQSCELSLMGMESNGIDVLRAFRPNDTISRAEVGTIISRVLRGTRYAAQEGEVRYQRHLQALVAAKILDDISTPMIPELRGRVMVMLMRIDL
jgi:hypothetical protein